MAGRTKFGLTLPNRGVIIGVTTVPEMLDLAERAESDGWDSVWVGDSLFAKPRLDAMVLLGALAARTKRVKLGPACFASAPLRDALLLAYQWASLDFMSGGRTIFVACQGKPEPGGGDFEHEFRAFRVDPSSRMRRMEEFIDILRLTTAQDHASYHGQFYDFDDVTVLPRPVQQPVPIWIVAQPEANKPKNVEAGYRRVARLADGWMTTRKTPDDVRTSLALIRGYAREMERDLADDFEVAIYHNINVNEDRQAAFDESKKYLDTYYSVNYHPEVVERWVALGSPEQCIEHLRRYIDAGATTITLRLTGYDQLHQFKRVTEEVLPALM